MAKSRLSKSEKQKVALADVISLLKEAENSFKSNVDSAHKFAKDARRKAMKVNLVLPRELKHKICRKCEHFLMPGSNCRIRTTNHHLVMRCMDCGNISRYGFLREQKETRNARSSSLKHKV